MNCNLTSEYDHVILVEREMLVLSSVWEGASSSKKECCMKLWEIPSEALLEQNLPGLLSLLPLTREGHQRETVEQMYQRLQQFGKTDLLAIGFSIAFHAFTQENEHQWLKEHCSAYEHINHFFRVATRSPPTYAQLVAAMCREHT
jgi:hypothetical protein